MDIEQGVIKFEIFVISESPVMPGFFLINDAVCKQILDFYSK